jgi:hypothetical protein
MFNFRLFLSISLLFGFTSSSPNSKSSFPRLILIHRHGDRSPITPLLDEEYWASQLPQPEHIKRLSEGVNIVRGEEVRDYERLLAGSATVTSPVRECVVGWRSRRFGNLCTLAKTGDHSHCLTTPTAFPSISTHPPPSSQTPT